VSYSGSGVTASFVYDGDGNRVKATFDGTTTVCVGNYYESPPPSLDTARQ